MNFEFMKGNVLVLTLTRAIQMFSMRMTMPFFSLFIIALGGEATDIGYVRTLRTLAALLIFPLAGYITDRQGRVKVIALSGFMSALTFLFFVFATDWTHVALGTFLQGLVMVHLPALGAIMADSLPPRQRGIGFALSMAIPTTFSIFSPYIGGYVVDRFGVVTAMRWLFASMLVLRLFSSAVRFKFLEETVDISGSGISLSSISQIMREAYGGVIGSLRWMPRNLWFLTVIMMLTSVSNAMVGPFWILYGLDVIGLSATQWGLLGLAAAVTSSVLGVPAGLVVDRVSKRLILIVGLAATLIPVWFFIYARSFWEVLALTLVISAANAFLMPACQTIVAESVPRELRGRIMSAIGRGVIMVTGPGVGGGGGGGPGMGFVLTVPIIVGSLVGGYIYSASPTFSWILLTGALALCVAISVVFVRDPQKIGS
ncbi:MFS transporter [Candidatus Bathyarchaeota archaeon]|nr:MFS transporter [Candidatus Bathyarchaeota archaeon]MBL7079845.1 MFS transporter [Candidatus Bathyarchaeota archaeon]